MPSRRRRRRRGGTGGVQAVQQTQAGGPSMGWKWRSFPTLVGFALGGLIASAAFYFTEPILLSFLLYVVFLFLSSFCLMRYTFRWSALKRIQARQRAERQAQQAAPRSGTTSQ